MSVFLVLKFSKYPLLPHYMGPFCKMEYINIAVL